MVLGNFTDDVTLLGTVAEVALGFTVVGTAADLRELISDLENWDDTPEHYLKTLLDLVGLIPVVGALKNADEVAALIKHSDEFADILKHGDEVVDVAKHGDEIADAAKHSDEFIDSFDDVPYSKLDDTVDDEFIKHFDEDAVDGGGNNRLPANDSQIKHIFRDTKGHLPDTPANRSLVESVGNNPSNFIGTDSYGTDWYSQIQFDGTQVWVRVYNGTVTNAGVNTTPITFDPRTGLNFNPFR